MSSRVNRYSSGGTNPLSLAAKKFSSKETEFKDGIKHIVEQAYLFAEGLKIAGEFEKTLQSANCEDDEKTQIFLTDQRNRIKAICAKSVAGNRYAECFALTMKDVQNEIQNKYTQNPSTQDAQDVVTDYEKQVNEKMAEHRAIQERESIAVEHEDIVRQCSKIIGEKETKKNLRSGTKEQADDDEELVVMNQSTSGTELRCPITAALFKNPVKSKVCGHVYEDTAARQCIAMGKGKMTCPIPGCNNRNVTVDQLEVDISTTLKLKVYLRKESSAKRQRTETVLEDDDVKDSGTTIIE